MANLSIIRQLSLTKDITLKELSRKVEISEHGLRKIIRSNSTKIETLEKIAEILGVPISIFFTTDSEPFNPLVPMYEFLHNPFVKVAVSRHEKITEKIDLLKDYFIWELLKIDKNKQVPIYPFEMPNGPGSLLINDSDRHTIFSINTLLFVPLFSKMDMNIKKSLQESEYLFDGFYFPIFAMNLFSINTLISDGLIKDNEILEYWEKWNNIKFKITKRNWKI